MVIVVLFFAVVGWLVMWGTIDAGRRLPAPRHRKGHYSMWARRYIEEPCPAKPRMPPERYWSDDPRHPDYGKPFQFRDGPRDPS